MSEGDLNTIGNGAYPGSGPAGSEKGATSSVAVPGLRVRGVPAVAGGAGEVITAASYAIHTELAGRGGLEAEILDQEAPSSAAA